MAVTETTSTPVADRWGGAARPRGRFGHIYGAIDLGTNNCRLLIAKPTTDGFRVIDAFSRIVRLGEGLTASGELSEAAIRRSIVALRVCADKVARRGVTQLRCVATEACRKAANGAEFIDRVQAATGLRFEIISTAEEARLALAGCAPLLDRRNRHALVFDIGGGSTEVLWTRLGGQQPQVTAWMSVPEGVVTLAERWGGVDVTPESWAGMVADVRRYLERFDTAHRISDTLGEGGVQLLGTSGTVTTVAGVYLDLPRYDRAKVDGIWLTLPDVQRISRGLAAMSYDERMAHPCIGRERADLVVAGCAVLEAISGLWPVERLRVADRGVREGVLERLMHDAERDAVMAQRRPQISA
jgi:exopolyphosphatase/guanosine-5'-triphosphate,3'-diphosphate pyrophosphatase